MTSNPLMAHITKENVLQAIERIDAEGIPSRRSSDSYDLVYNNIAYPPKYIISLAGYFSNTGKFIFGSKFKGGENTDCFELLRGLGFKIIPKTETKNLKTPDFSGDIHFKYCYLVLDETIDNQRFEKSFQEYISYCKRSHWIDRNEAYKFRFGRWISERVDFDNQSDQEILDLCIRSQDNVYSEQFKGVNFILTTKRYNDHFIIKKDIETLRKLNDGGLLEDEDLKESPLSPTKLGIWAGCLIPEKYSILANGELFLGLQYLFNFPSDIPKNKVRNFNICNTALNEIKALVQSKFQNEAQEICSMIFENSPITLVDYTWLVQDFILFLNRRVLMHNRNYYWVFQGDNYELEKKHGIVAAPTSKNLHHWKRVREIKEGDIIVHYSDSAIRAISMVKKEFVKGTQSYLRDNTENYIVETNYEELDKPIPIEHIQNIFAANPDILPRSQGPLNSKLKPNQMYMCKFNENSYNLLFNMPNYWVFQGNPKIYDAVKAIREGELGTWSMHAHKSKIKIGDKIILWLTGSKSGCYALAEVTSDLFHSQEASNEIKYYSQDPGKVSSDKVSINITHDLTGNPALKEDLLKHSEFIDFNGGNQGTNFTATERQYQIILNMIDHKEPENYWLYQPGEDADGWKECVEKNIMTIGWDDLGDTSRFKDKEAIREKLQELENTEGSKKNDTKANEDFLRTMQVGDVVIVKKGISVLLGYGFIESDYFYDASVNRYQKRRKMTWKKTGEWLAGHDLVQKTLTNITEYKSEELSPGKTYYQALIDIMNGNEINQQAKKSRRHPKNTILFGPPGTGKTYKLKTKYFTEYTSKDEEISREVRILEVLKNLTWWQVITIVLLDLKEAKAKDIYNHELVKLKEKLTTSKNVDSTIRGKLQAHTVDSCEIVNTTHKVMPLIFYKEQGAIWRLDQEGFEDVQEDINELAELCKADKINKASEIKRYEFVTFHQSYAYEDFIEGIKPVMETEGNGELSYEIKDGLFKTLCQRAKNDPENKYAIFIDEINRGNVSSIFGELITLIEPDKRIGMENAMTATLPYSRDTFGVPSNVDIYGTMNTADRSVEALDTALRRRFSFEEMMPKVDDLSDNMEGISLKELLVCINDRIEALIDRDHTIGHSYLINVKNMEDLKLTFKDKIIPLLQEYFYGDYGKIGLVLGGGFVKMHAQDNEIFADFEYDGSDGLAQNKFELITIDEAFDMEGAIETLLNNSVE